MTSTDIRKIDKRDLQSLITNNIVTKSNEVHELFNSTKLENKILLCCEGPSDVKVYGPIFNKDYVFIKPFGTCNNLPLFIEKLTEEFGNRIIAIKDADFDYLNKKTYTCKNLFLTDTHDLETMLFDADVEDKLYFSYLHNDESLGKSFSIVSDVMQHLEDVSYLKWMNSAENLALNVSCISFSEENYDGYSPVNIEKCIQKMRSIPDNNVKCGDIKKSYSEFRNNHECNDLKLLVNGHDLCSVIALYLKFHDSTDGNVNETRVSSIAISAYNMEKFSKTALYQKLLEWADINNKILFYAQ